MSTYVDTWYRDGNVVVLVRHGMPEVHVQVGTGDTYAEALADLRQTPVQSTGRDQGHGRALSWAYRAGLIGGEVVEDEEGPSDADLDAIADDAIDAAEDEAHGVVPR